MGAIVLKVIKEHEDYNSRLKLGDIISIPLDSFDTDIVNIKGAHYKVYEIEEYFEVING